MDVIYYDDDHSLEYKNNNIDINELESVLSYIMKDVSHLWRFAKISDIRESTLIKKEGQNNKCKNHSQSVIKTSAYMKRDNEETLSVFELDGRMRCVEGQNLCIEAYTLMTVLSAQSYKFDNKSLPLALIKEKLKNILLREENNINIIKLIEKSPPEEQENTAAHHWDIYLPSSDEDRQKLYLMLALSSEAYPIKEDFNFFRLAGKALDTKRKSKRQEN